MYGSVCTETCSSLSSVVFVKFDHFFHFSLSPKKFGKCLVHRVPPPRPDGESAGSTDFARFGLHGPRTSDSMPN